MQHVRACSTSGACVVAHGLDSFVAAGSSTKPDVIRDSTGHAARQVPAGSGAKPGVTCNSRGHAARQVHALQHMVLMVCSCRERCKARCDMQLKRACSTAGACIAAHGFDGFPVGSANPGVTHDSTRPKRIRCVVAHGVDDSARSKPKPGVTHNSTEHASRQLTVLSRSLLLICANGVPCQNPQRATTELHWLLHVPHHTCSTFLRCCEPEPVDSEHCHNSAAPAVAHPTPDQQRS
eukprot:1156831-Pelagomonas_calceolata.AAC.3